MQRALLAIAILSASSPAHALLQAKHKELAVNACLAQKLPSAFCTRVGNEDYDVDAAEFDVLAAHAMPDTQSTPHCTAANAAAERLRQLGGSIRVELSELAISSSSTGVAQLAADLGGALHTIQDNCAHAGQPNPQHAYYSLSDDCLSTSVSPDVQTAAITCAANESAKVFAAFKTQLNVSGLSVTRLGTDLGSTALPPRGQVCSYLLEADNWDGYDHRWNNNLVIPALQSQIDHALNVDDTFYDVCRGNPGALDIASKLLVKSPASTNLVQHWCFTMNTYCLGYY